MKKLLMFFGMMILLGSLTYAQIEIDGDMLDWAGINPLDQGPAEEQVGDVPGAEYSNFDLKHLYITHDSANVYVRIDLKDDASFANFFNYDNPPVFEFYMDTEIGDTSGFDWGWWNIAMNYYVDLAPTLNPDSTEKRGILYKYNGNRMPTWVEGEFDSLGVVPMAINDVGNSLEFAIPRELVNFGSEFRPFVYSVGDYQWTDGADNLPNPAGEYMLKYDFWYGGSAYQHVGDQISSEIIIDGDMLDWATIQAADKDQIAEELGDMATGPEFDVQDMYVTSDSNFIYVRIDINPSATFAGMYNNYDESPAFQLFFDSNWGDTSGLGYGGFWRLPVDYMIDLSAALHPDSIGNEVPVYKYAADWMGAFEEFTPLADSIFATFAKNDEDNSVEIAVPRSAINTDTDVRPWLYVVGNGIWDNEEYVPNTVHEGWGGAEDEYYALNYNFINGVTIHRLGDKSVTTSVESEGNDYSKVKGFGLVANYPNPFNPSTKITFTVSEQDMITLSIYDVLGRKVATLINNELMQPGLKNVTWNSQNQNGNSMASGIYIYKISSSKFSVSKKMMLLK